MQTQDFLPRSGYGIVTHFDPATMTCTVRQRWGGTLRNCAILNSTGGLLSNTTGLQHDPKLAVVHWQEIDGRIYVTDLIPQIARPRTRIANSGSNAGVGGDNKQAYGTGASSGNSFAGGGDTGVSPGDKVIAADGEAKIQVCKGDCVNIQASPASKITLGGGGMDFIRFFAKEIKFMSDAGELEFSGGSKGRTGIALSVGAEYGAEARSGSQKTCYMAMGDCGNDDPMVADARFALLVRSTDGGDHGALTMGKDGQLKFSTSKDYTLAIDKDVNVNVKGNHFREVKGQDITKVHNVRSMHVVGNEYLKVDAKRQINVASKEDHTVGGDMNLQVAGTLTVGCGSLVLTSYSGGTGPCEMQCSSFNLKKG